MKLARFYQFLLITTFFCTFYGCIDAPVYNNSYVEGNIIDEYGMPNPYVLVSVGDYPIVAPDATGKFRLENSANPYDVVFTRSSYTVFKYSGLTRSNLNFCTFDDPGYNTNTYVNVVYPRSSELSWLYIKFISKESFFQYEYEFLSFDSIVRLPLALANGRSQIEGQILFLELDDYLYEYTRCGIKNVVLNTGYNNQPVIFNDSDVSFNPPEFFNYCNVQVVGNYYGEYSRVSLSFPGMNKNSTIDFHDSFQRYFYVPDIPSLDYKVKITNFLQPSIINYRDHSLSSKWVFTEPGENIELTHERTLFLQTPYDGETNITPSSVFSFEDTEPHGIYVFSIIYRSQSNYFLIHLAADKNSLTLSDFKTRGYQFTPNTTYYWSVRKYPGYGSIDEFASGKFMNDTTYSKIPASETFMFVTH